MAMTETAKVFIQPNWLLPDITNPNDWLLWDLWLDVKNFPIMKWKLPPYNQAKLVKSRSACTIINAFRERCCVNSITPKDTDFSDLIDWCVKYQWYIIGQWRWSESAMNAVLKWTKIKYPHIKCNYVKMKWESPEIYTLLEKWYPLWVTYGGNAVYNWDYQKDTVLDWAVFWPVTYGHRTTLVKTINYRINDSYAGETFNIYTLKQFQTLFINGTYNPWIYIRVSDIVANEEEIKRLTTFRWHCEQANKFLLLAKDISNSDNIYKTACQGMINMNLAKISAINAMLASRNTSTLI